MHVMLKNREIDRGLTLIKPFTQRGLSVKVSFAIGKTCRRLREVIEVMQEERKKLVEKHQLTDNDGKRIEEKDGSIKLENIADFSDDFIELMKQETEVDVHQLQLEELEMMKDRDGKKLQPTPEEMEGLLLLQMIMGEEDKEEEEEEEKVPKMSNK